MEHLARSSGLRNRQRPGFRHDRLRTRLAQGRPAFELAIQKFKAWKQFDLGWTRVANPQAQISLGQIVALEVHSLGLWSLNLSQIVELEEEEAHCFGFIYKTLEDHVEEGEERFLLTFDETTGVVCYETEAISRPRSLLALLGYPVTRAFQHRFVRDSHRRMREEVDRPTLKD